MKLYAMMENGTWELEYMAGKERNGMEQNQATDTISISNKKFKPWITTGMLISIILKEESENTRFISA